MNGKRRVAILCGGQSAEHKVSLLSANSVVNAIDRDRNDVAVVGIDHAGRWWELPADDFVVYPDDPEAVRLADGGTPVALIRSDAGPCFHRLDGSGELAVDVAFPVMHGTGAEDGTIQGLLKLVGMPFVGAGVLGSAVGMDKVVMKRLLRDAGLPIGPFLVFSNHQRDQIDFAAVSAELGLPVFIKPANLGSSVGIHKAETAAEFAAGIADAFRYDRKILIEANIAGREIECAVLGGDPPRASIPGEVIPTHSDGWYSYKAKYLDPNGAKLAIPAELPEAIVARVRDLAIKTFEALCCEGLGRVDLFYCPDGTLCVNEINTLPGFTSISMYPKLWDITGIPYPELIDRLLDLAIERGAEEAALVSVLEDE